MNELYLRQQHSLTTILLNSLLSKPSVTNILVTSKLEDKLRMRTFNCLLKTTWKLTFEEEKQRSRRRRGGGRRRRSRGGERRKKNEKERDFCLDLMFIEDTASDANLVSSVKYDPSAQNHYSLLLARYSRWGFYGFIRHAR